MILAFESLLPSFLLIALGFALSRTALMPPEQWEGLERLNYFVLYPMLLFVSVVRADFGGVPVLTMAAAMAGATAAVATGMVATRRLWLAYGKVDAAGFTSHLQGAIRYQTAVALAVSGALFGREGLALAAVGVVAIIPLVNVICVIALARLKPAAGSPTLALVKDIALNPLILATMTGAAVQVSGVSLYAPLAETLDLLGRGALGLALLLVGAGLRPSALTPRLDVAVNVAVKLSLMPTVMAGVAVLLGIEGVALAVVVITGAVPASGSAYVLARRMGGDAELMASLIAAQTFVAFATLPVALWLAGGAAAPP